MATLRTLALAMLAVGLCSPLASAQGRVTYVNRNGERTTMANVIITGETLGQVTVSDGGNERTIDTSDVIEVVYGPGSEAFQQGQQALDKGDLPNALALLATAKDDTDPPWVGAVALLDLARAALSRDGGEAQANSAVDEFVQRFPDHRRLPEALLIRARAQGAAGDAAAAAAAVEQVEALADAGRVTPDWRLRALLVHGEILLAAGDVRRASEVYTEAERATGLAANEIGDRPDLAPVIASLGLSAKVGVGRALLADDNVAQARSYYSALQREASGDSAVRAAAGNGLAECDFRDGRFKEAQLGFAKVAIEAAGTPEEHARALYFLGRCAQELDKTGAEPSGANRAVAYFQEVQKRYPQTSWARQSAQARP